MATRESAEGRRVERGELTLLLTAHREWVDTHGARGQRLELNGADLSDMDLAERVLDKAKLVRVNLSGSDLSGASLRGADLTWCSLKGARLSGADLHEACLADADLSGARLRNTDFTNADLEGADARGADITGVILTGTDLTGTVFDTTVGDAGLDAAYEAEEVLDDTGPEAEAISELPDADLEAEAPPPPRKPAARRPGRRKPKFPEPPPEPEEPAPSPELIAFSQGGGSRRVDEELLSEILEHHRRWLESGGRRGGQARLEGADLRDVVYWGADLSRARLFAADLRGAFLPMARLDEANLVDARLEGATLFQSSMREADLHSADFNGADLSAADLSAACNLTAPQLGGADLTGAALPQAIAPFSEVGRVTELARMARKVFLIWVVAGLYVAVAALSAPARGGGVPLPFTGVSLPPVLFHAAAPLFLTLGFLWLHLYLQRLWDELAELPAVFPDGHTLDRKVTPWLVAGLVHFRLRRLRERAVPLGGLQRVAAGVMAWGGAPLALAALSAAAWNVGGGWGAFGYATGAIVCAAFGLHARNLFTRTLGRD